MEEKLESMDKQPNNSSEITESANQNPNPELNELDKAEKAHVIEEQEVAKMPDSAEDSNHSEEEDHLEEESQEEIELPDYSEFKNEALLLEAKSLFKNYEPQKIKRQMEAIRFQLLHNLDVERDEKKQEFLDKGGVEIDFEYHQPMREQFKALYQEYRVRRNQYYAQLKAELEMNLERRKQIIERLKDLVDKEENLTSTFEEFKQIQDDWRNAGSIPSSAYAEVYNLYHFHLDNFYDFIKINKQLRDYDFKKNQELKEELISKVEALASEADLRKAFSELQALHKQWKEVGPVAKELRDELWDKFSAATKVLHDKRQEFQDQLRAERDQWIANKKEIVAVLQNINVEGVSSHQEWQKIMKGVEEAREAFRKIGRVIHPENDAVWESFTEATRNITKAKNQFYKAVKHDQIANLKIKKELLAKANELKDSEDWKETTEVFKKIQQQWKTVGPVPKADSDKIWKEFRDACNHFFNRMQESNKKVDAQFEENYNKKKELLAQYQASSDQEFNLQGLKDLISNWKSLGPVPRDKKSIEVDFNQWIDAKFEKLNLDKVEGILVRFENKMNGFMEAGEAFKIAKENDFLRKKLDETQRELAQLETNINFFSSKDGKNPFLKDVERSIKNHKESMEILQAKIKLLRKFPAEVFNSRPRENREGNRPFNKNRKGGAPRK